MAHAKLTITENPGASRAPGYQGVGPDLTVVVEADPPVPVKRDGTPDVDSPLFKPMHGAAILAAMTIGESGGAPMEWRHLIKDGG